MVQQNRSKRRSTRFTLVTILCSGMVELHLQGLHGSVSSDQLRHKIAELYSTPAMAASTASISAPKSRPSEAAPVPGETLGQPGPFSWQSLGSLLTPFLRSRMPAASGDPTTMFPLGKDPRPLMMRFLSNL